MKIGMLEHVALRTSRLDELVQWYGQVLGMHPGWRPDFPFPGAWLYSGDNKPTIHLVGIPSTVPAGHRSGHFAFSAVGLAACIARLRQLDVRYEVVALPEAHLVQVNLCDPDGNQLHVDFPAHEAADVPQESIGRFTAPQGSKQG